jgi:hypothetical protein
MFLIVTIEYLIVCLKVFLSFNFCAFGQWPSLLMYNLNDLRLGWVIEHSRSGMETDPNFF